MSTLFTLDERYATHCIWCGHEKPKYRATFCDDLLGYYDTKELAEIRCYNHRLEFLESLLPNVTV